MKNRIYKFAALTLAAAFLQSCGTSKAQRAVEEKIANEPAIKSERVLELKQEDTIASAPGLTDDQRQKLNELRANAQAKAKSIEEQSLKLREILIKNLVASDYNSKKSNEVQAIKGKLTKLNRERLEVMLNSIEQAQVILGRQAKDNESMMNSFLERDFDSRGSR